MVKGMINYLEIQREGIVIKCNQKLVNDLLFNGRELNAKELQELRNEYVKTLADLLEIAHKENDYDAVEDIHSLMTVITGTIDNKIYNLAV